ncbi:hypothetical protein MNBD_NITROSPINAE01-1134 [hydrothermal vent metagenome]|uniref:Uncharacterized protein n=1 Tax=hydrothermal vent metagenome TaxID=652676 RepID=A0A3B1CH48_9ZZZZ
MGKHKRLNDGSFISFSGVALKRFTEMDAMGGVYKGNSTVARLLTRNGKEPVAGSHANDALDRKMLERVLKGVWNPVV